MMGRLGRYESALALLCLLLAVDSSWTQTCGKRKVNNFLIVRGTEAKDGYWPWHAALFRYDSPSLTYTCGGTILDHNIILTAAHCVMTANGIIARERLFVHVGRNRLSIGGNRVQEHEALQLIVHPERNVNGIKHDIALIKLATDITYNDYVQPICLWNRGEDLNAIVGMKGTVVGFGIDETGNVSDTLREATIPVVSHMTCIESNRNAFAYHLTSNMFCAGNRDGIAACNGDSGGGMFFKYDDVWYIRGVVSFTKPHQDALICDSKEYTVFTDVAKYLDWIVQHLRETSGHPVVLKTDVKHKVRLLSMSTCGNLSNEQPLDIFRNELDYPWVGVLEYTHTALRRKISACYATLISDSYLVTTALCLNYPDFRYTLSSVRLGENMTPDCALVDEQRICAPSVQILRIESAVSHIDYSSGNYDNDIALIRLRDRATTRWRNVKPICLPVTKELQTQSVYLSHRYANIDDLYEGLFVNDCRKLMNGECLEDKTYSQICVNHEYTHRQKRLETSGAPLQLEQQIQGTYRYVLYGVLSFLNSTCNPRYPKVFTNVTSYMDWILENIQE